MPVFLADIKGDLTGLGVAASVSDKLSKRLKAIDANDWHPQSYPIELWDVYGEKGIPVRATVSNLGPLLLSRILNLNEVQSGILQLAFKIADDNQLLLLDFKDLRELIKYVGDNAKSFTTDYGNISAASIGAIQRNLLALDQQGAEKFFGEPMLDINDLIQQNAKGQGKINILECEKLFNAPKLYSIFLLWLLSELFEQLPEVGDIDKPKLVFFFDEAHLLFNGIPKVLLDKIEQVVRLIRSKGVGIYFVTQNPTDIPDSILGQLGNRVQQDRKSTRLNSSHPTDIPDSILGQLGNRVQHALRSFSVNDQKAVRAAAKTMNQNPKIDTEKVITTLGVGEALISFLDEHGRPNQVETGAIIAPQSLMGAMPIDQQQSIINQSNLNQKYTQTIDRNSAYEMLKAGFHHSDNIAQPESSSEQSGGFWDMLKGFLFGTKGSRGGNKDGLAQKVVQSTSRQIANNIGREITRGILGSLKKK